MNSPTTGLAALVHASVRRHGSEPALQSAGTSLTYDEMWAAAGQLARRLVSRCGNPPTHIALHARRDTLTYLGYLAALRLGATVIPLNPEFPLARNSAIVRAAGADAVVGSDADVCAELVREGRPVACAVGGQELLAAADRPEPGLPATPVVGPEDIAYVLFTSGSTGRSKGVPIRHGNVCGYVEHHVRQRRSGPGSRFSQSFDLTFDPSVYDMFVAWCSGATLVVPSREELHDPVDFINRQRITHWFSVPSVISLARRMRRLPADSMPGLKWSLFAGEQLTWEQADTWQRAAPQSRLENLYGPTELTITCTGYQVPDSASARPQTRNGTVPIGHPHPLVDHVLVDEDGRVGDEGELCVRGPQRFAGYLDPADNTNRFVQIVDGQAHPVEVSDAAPAEVYYRTGDLVSRHASGVLVHHSRLDNQVKLHGYRVELGEVEAALRTHPETEEAVVVVPEGTADPVAFYTGAESEAAGLMAHLQRSLPWYMVPSRYHHLRQLPLNGNGKVDRRALVALAAGRARPTNAP